MQRWLKIKKLTPTAKLPERQTEGAAGYDLYADEGGIVYPEDKLLVSTGVAMAIPPGCVGIIKSRSGLAVKNLEVGAGVIDADYRGEVKVLLRNHSTVYPHNLIKGTRIAQLLIVPIVHPIVQDVEDLDATMRNEGGFGSTGE